MSVKTKKHNRNSTPNAVQPYINEINEINKKYSDMTLDTPEEKQSVINLLLNALSKYQDGSTTTTRIDSINGFEQKTNEICSTLSDILSNGEDYLDPNGNINIEHARLKPIIDILDNDNGDVKEFINNLNKSGYIKNASNELQNLLETKKNGGSDPLLKKYNGGENTFFDKFTKSNGGHHFFMGVGQNHKFINQSQGLLMFFFNIGDEKNKTNTKEFIDNQISFANLKINGSLYLIKKLTKTVEPSQTDNTATSTTSEFIIGPFDADLELSMDTHKISNLNCKDFNLDFFKLFCGQQDYFDTDKLDDIDDPCYCFRNKLKPKIGDEFNVGDVIKDSFNNFFKITNVNGDEYTVDGTNESGTHDKNMNKIINKTKLREYNKVNAAAAPAATADSDKTNAKTAAQDNGNKSSVLKSLRIISGISGVENFITVSNSVISDIHPIVSSTNPPCYDDTGYIENNKTEFDKIDKKLSKFSEIYNKIFNMNDDFISKPTYIISAIQEISGYKPGLLTDLTQKYAWEIIPDEIISGQISSSNVLIENTNFNGNDSSYKFFEDSCQIKYLGDKNFLVVPRILKKPSTDNSVTVHYKSRSKEVQSNSNSSSLFYLNNAVLIAEKNTSTAQKVVSSLSSSLSHLITMITYKEVKISTSSNEPFNASFYKTGINDFYINDKDVVMNAITQIQQRFPYDPNRNEITIIGSLIFLCLCFGFYTTFVSPLLLWLYNYVSKVALVGTAINLFNNPDLLNIITGNVNLNAPIASTSNFAITMLLSLISLTVMIMSLISLVMSGFGHALIFSKQSFNFINKTYAKGIARLTIYYLAPALSTNNQYNRLLQDSFQKNPNFFLEIKDKNLNAQQMLSVKSGKNNSVSDKVNLFLKSDLWSINLWKIVLYVLLMTAVVFVHDKKRGGKLSRKAKNNKKTKKPRILKRAKKTLRRRKISGGGNTVDIENMKNLTGITYFLLSAFSGYYSSLSSIQVPKFMSEAVKVFLKL